MPVRISKNRVALENIPLNLSPEVDVASATTTNIGAATSNNVRITGTTTITAFDNVSSGVIRFIRFSGALTLTRNATSLILPGGANITTATGDSCLAVSLGSGNWLVHFYQKASGAAVVASSNKNAIINGNFDIWQRGTSFSTASTYTADRFFISAAGSTFSTSRQLFTLGQTDVPNEPNYFLRDIVTSVAGAANASNLIQHIESVRTYAGKTVTLSLYAKADASKNVAVEFVQNMGSGGSPSSNVLGIGVTTLALTTSWQKFTITTTIPSISGKTLGTNNNDTLDVNIWFEAGSNFNSRTNSLGQQSGTFDIAQVQLEEGSSATAFEYRTLGQEIALCQRYYCKSFNINTTPANGSTASNFATSYGIYESAAVRAASGVAASDDGSSVYTNPGGTVRFPVSMRATPTVTKYGNSSGNWRIKDSANDNWPSVPVVEIGTGGFVVSVSSWIDVNVVAYTVGHWVADAEF